MAIDNDPIAIKVASENAELNKVKIDVGRLPVSRVNGRFSVVAANIQSNTLLRLKKNLFAKVAPTGFLVLSEYSRARPIVSKRPTKNRPRT